MLSLSAEPITMREAAQAPLIASSIGVTHKAGQAGDAQSLHPRGVIVKSGRHRSPLSANYVVLPILRRTWTSLI
ncbi:hypothetical protein, partial [Azohydromonas sp.]|uniref:hypothetical protein n=1 Tax=Azohydromonas sp. TaxID=1872666 RepID=UPI002D1F9B13